MKTIMILTVLFFANGALAQSAESLIARGESYDRRAEQKRLRELDRRLKQADAEFQQRGGRMPLQEVEASALERMGLSSAGAYRQFPRGKNGRYGAGKSVIVLANGEYCTTEHTGWAVNIFTCRTRDGAPFA